MKEEVLHIFTSYLETHQQRRTPERFAILEEIYDRSTHFHAEELYEKMKNKNFRISRATVYNTLELLQQCDLIKKHQFNTGQAIYERSYGFRQHDHLICSDCNQLLEFCDPRIQQIKDKMGEILQFNIFHHALTLYGKCNNASCPNRKKEKPINQEPI
jgi:Fur family transcriptional regulator, ferric uptake regulator